MSLAAEKHVQDFAVNFDAIKIIIVQLIEHGQEVIPIGQMIKSSRPFYWILLKEANLYILDFRYTAYNSK